MHILILVIKQQSHKLERVNCSLTDGHLETDTIGNAPAQAFKDGHLTRKGIAEVVKNEHMKAKDGSIVGKRKSWKLCKTIRIRDKKMNKNSEIFWGYVTISCPRAQERYKCTGKIHTHTFVTQCDKHSKKGNWVQSYTPYKHSRHTPLIIYCIFFCTVFIKDVTENKFYQELQPTSLLPKGGIQEHMFLWLLKCGKKAHF